MGEAPPEEHGIVERFYVRKYARTGRCESGDGLKERVYEVRYLPADDKSQSAEETEKHP